LNSCFEVDWNRSKIDRVVKNEEERERLKVYVKSIYKWFREMYKYTAGVDPMKDVMCIGTNVFSELCNNSCPTLIDGKYLKLSDLDLERIQTNANEKNNKHNPKEKLVRHNFLEVFIRLCDTKYVKNGAGDGDKSITNCFKMMFDNELETHFRKFDTLAWRKEFLWVEEIDLVLKQGLDALKLLYKKFIGKNSMPGSLMYMSLSEFETLISDSDCHSDNFGAKQVSACYNLAMMTQIDEIEKERHLNMTFVEFVEAIVRVAQKCEIPHMVDDEYIPNETEVFPEHKVEWATRPLNVKIESLILLLID
jgi:hypothetical protein